MGKKIRLAALDLDGTLLNSQKTISPRDLEALNRAHAMGVEIVPVTGRAVGGLPKAVLALPYIRYAVTSNGATISDLDENLLLLEKHLTPERALEVLDACRDIPMIREVFREGIGYLITSDRDILWKTYEGTPMMAYVLGSRQVLDTTLEEFLQEDHRPVEELFFLTDSQETKEALQRRLEALGDLSFADPAPSDLEVLAGGIDKGEGLRWLVDHLGLDPQEVLAMGDGGSDIPLLQAAGVGVAMDNALDHVKAAADWVTLSCDEGGVAAAFEKYIFNRE